MIAFLFWLSVGFIFYTYLGYPALLALFARTKPKPKPYEAIYPSITLIIAAYNEADIIVTKIENCLSLDYPKDKLQILIAADGSNDRTVETVQSYANEGVKLSFHPERRGKMAAINHAITNVGGEIIVFSDANNMYAVNALKELAAPFSDPTVGVVSGAKRIKKGDGALGESEGLYWQYESFIKEQETRLGCMSGGMAGEILAIRRELFQPVPSHIINDDFHIAMQVIRSGQRIVYAPGAHSYERVAPSAHDEMTRRTRMNAGLFQSMTMALELIPLNRPLFWWQIVSHKFIRPFVPFTMISALITNIIAVLLPSRNKRTLWRLASPFNVILLIFQIFFYTLAWLGNKLETDRKLPEFLYLPTFLVNSNIAALEGLCRFLTGRRTVLWQRVARREKEKD